MAYFEMFPKLFYDNKGDGKETLQTNLLTRLVLRTDMRDDAFDFDYSWLGIDDLIFISVDVEHKRIFSKIIETSKAQLHVCAPYDNTWLYNLLKAKGSI